MRIKARLITAVAVGFSLVFAAGVAWAQQDQRMQGGQQQRQGAQQGYGQGYYNQMGPDQLQMMQGIQAEYGDKIYELRSRLYAKQQELSAVMAADQFNPDQARSLVSEINELRSELYSTRMEMQIEMRQEGLMPSYGGYGMAPGGRQGGYGMRPGRMGPGMRQGGYPMGPGMMHGGRGMGPGMMGPGMMRGMGPGMMYQGPAR